MDPEGLRGLEGPNGFVVPISAIDEPVAFVVPIRGQGDEVEDFRFEQFNDSMRRALNLHTSHPHLSGLSDLGLESWRDTLNAALSQQLTLSTSVRVRRGPGQSAELELRATPLWFGLFVTLRPNRAVAAIATTPTPETAISSEFWFRRVVETAPYLLAAVTHGKVEWISQSITQQLGWDLADLHAVDVLELIHPDDRRAFRLLQAAAHGQESVCIRHRVRDKAGEFHWLETCASPLLGAEGFSSGLLAASRVIDDSIIREAHLVGESEYMRSLLDQLPVGVFRMLVRPSGRRSLEYANERVFTDLALQQVLPTDTEEFPHSSLAHPDDLKAFREAIDLSIDTGEDLFVETRVLLPSGTRWLRTQGVVYPAGEGAIVEGVQIDITLQKEFEQQLLVAEAAAKSATAAKSNFLAKMSHEIRTPLTAALGCLELLKGTHLTARQSDYVSKSERAAHSLLAVINDILDISKIEAGRLELRHSPFELEQILRDISAVLSANAGVKPVGVIYEVDSSMPNLLIGDGERLRQILINLLSNSLKFTEVGEVRLSIKMLDSSDSAVTVAFQVDDTGIGMSEQTLQRVMEDFFQGEDSNARRYQGTGLGLPLCKRLLELMGSELSLNSQLGVGTAASFKLTLRVAQSPTRPPIRRKFRLLAVTPYPRFAASLSEQCSELGWDLVLVESAESACEQLGEVAEEHHFDAVILESHQISSSLTRDLLKLSSPEQPELPLVLITNSSSQLNRNLDEVAALKISGTLIRPFTNLQLYEAVERVSSAESTAIRAVLPTAPLAGLRLLLAEDNELSQEVAVNLLERAGAHVTAVVDGLAAVKAVEQEPSAFDAVLMDVQMPGLDGLEATRQIRATAAGAGLPIIGITANAMNGQLQQCIEAGMTAVVTKPFDKAGLEAAVLKWVGGSQRVDSPVDRPRNGSDSPLLDVQGALTRLGDDRTFYVRVLERFNLKLSQSADALRAVDSTFELKQQVHGLKGAAATAGAVQLAKAAAELEALLLDQTDPKAVTAATEAMLEVLTRTQDALNSLLAASGRG